MESEDTAKLSLKRRLIKFLRARVDTSKCATWLKNGLSCHALSTAQDEDHLPCHEFHGNWVWVDITGYLIPRIERLRRTMGRQLRYTNVPHWVSTWGDNLSLVETCWSRRHSQWTVYNFCPSWFLYLSMACLVKCSESLCAISSDKPALFVFLLGIFSLLLGIIVIPFLYFWSTNLSFHFDIDRIWTRAPISVGVFSD